MTLGRGRRRNVIVVAAVFVIGNQDDRVFPVRAVANRVDHLRNEGLASLNVGRRMFVIFRSGAGKHAEIRIDEGNAWQWPDTRYRNSGCLSKECIQRKEVRIDAGRAEQAERSALRHILKVIEPGDFILVEQIQDGAGNRLVTAWRRKRVVRGQVSK